jgi:hypothetical protein
MIFYIKLIFLAVVLQSPLGYRIDGKGFPLQQVALVLFILNDTKGARVLPYDSSVLEGAFKVSGINRKPNS